MVEAQPFGIAPVAGATAGDLASFTAAGLLQDSGISSAVAHDPASLYVAANGNDSTAARGRSDLPFATLNAAAGVAVPGDTIRLGVGTFAPLTATLPAWVRLVGSGRPHVDSVTAPTTLVGGSIIQGPLLPSNDGFELHHAGVDSGSAVCAALYGGAAQDALAVSNVPSSHPTGLPQLKGVRLHDIACLAQSETAPVHACRIENVIGADVAGMETWFGVHGLALKGVDCNVRGLVATGHQDDGLILKADNYAPCACVNVCGVVIRPLGAGTGGLIVLGSTNPIASINISNYHAEAGLGFGLQVDGPGGLTAVNISNAVLVGCSDAAVTLTATACDRVTLAQVHVVGAGGHGFVVPSECYRTQLIGCEASSCGGDGFNLTSGSAASGQTINLTGCAAYGNSANGFNNLGSTTYGQALLATGNTTANFAGNAIADPGPTSGVSAGTYTAATLTVDAQGRLTSAASGSYDPAGSAATAQSNAETYASNASNLTSGTVATARLASGTASGSTYLRGDQTWDALPAAPGATNGSVSLSSAYNVTTSFATVTGMTVTLPAAGTYIVTGQIRVVIAANAELVTLQLQNTTTSVTVAGPWICGYINVTGGGGNANQNTWSFTAIVITTASNVIALQAESNATGNQIYQDAGGGSFMQYARIA